MLELASLHLSTDLLIVALAGLLPLAVTFAVGVTRPRWAYVPAVIGAAVFTSFWIYSWAKDSAGSEAWLFYGAMYGAALLIAGSLGRLIRPADGPDDA